MQFSGSAGMAPHALLSVDLGSGQWTNESATLPSGLAVTHFGAAVADGRYLFIVAGQVSDWVSVGNDLGLPKCSAQVTTLSSPAVLPHSERYRVRQCHCGSLPAGFADAARAGNPKLARGQVGDWRVLGGVLHICPPAYLLTAWTSNPCSLPLACLALPTGTRLPWPCWTMAACMCLVACCPTALHQHANTGAWASTQVQWVQPASGN